MKEDKPYYKHFWSLLVRLENITHSLLSHLFVVNKQKIVTRLLTMVTAESTTELLSQANELLTSHAILIDKIRSAQIKFRQQLRTLPSPAAELIKLPIAPSPPLSPDDDLPLPSPIIKPEELDLGRLDLPPAKKARLVRYQNYVPEEETIRNDYSQRYVDGGEWPQNWVIGAEPEHRFEE